MRYLLEKLGLVKRIEPRSIAALPVPVRANQKGQGFRFLPANVNDPQGWDIQWSGKKWAMILGGAGGIIFLLLLVLRAAPDFIILTEILLALCGLVLHDTQTRRQWERTMDHRFHKLSDHHDRLVREVARNRNDVAALKEGLSEMALTVEAQGRRLGPALSAEARLIETIIARLGALGGSPRSGLRTADDSRILELEMAPPPPRPSPVNDLDAGANNPADSYTDSTIKDLLNHTIRGNDIEVFLQPVVALPQRRIRFHEAYARLRAGKGITLPAEQYMDIARREQLAAGIDNLLLLRCLQWLSERSGENPPLPFIININGSTLADRSFMGDLVSFLAQNKNMSSCIILEMNQGDLETLEETISPVLEGLSRLGIRFSMDGIRRRAIDITFLKRRQIRFVKMDAEWLVHEGSSKNGFSRIMRLKRELDAAGVDLIVERIESEVMLRELLDYNIDYGQGWLFGKPDTHLAYRDVKRVA